jgi:Diacylglycerol kinase catalytic domain
MAERVLLLFNRASGTGHSKPLFSGLEKAFRDGAGGGCEISTATLQSHPAARRLTREFLCASDGGSVVIAGGGGGTLRAVVEGICDDSPSSLPGRDRVRVGALRLGSGNVVAKRLGVPLDPIQGAHALGASMRSGRTASCAVLRCRFGTADGADDVRHAVTMCGLGQFGRTPGDLVRWHHFLGRRRQLLVRAAGIERVNDVEYAVASAGRFAASLAFPRLCEKVEVSLNGRRRTLRLLAGVVMNLPIRGIPFDPGVDIGDAAAGVRLLPVPGLPISARLDRRHSLRLRLLDRDSVEFFLDEDPERAYRELTVEVAGTLAFLPGSS